MSTKQRSEKEKRPDLIETGNNIAALRNARSITQEELGARAGGISGNGVSRIETGKTDLRVTLFFRFSEALQATPNDLSPRRLLVGTPLERYDLLNRRNRETLRQFIDVLLNGQNESE